MLQVNNLRKVYSNGLGLHQASFTAEAGEVLAIVGPNGAGKSTLIKILCSIHSPDAGVCLLDNQPIKQMKSDLGFLPETPYLIDELTCSQFLRYIASMKGVSDESEIVSRLLYFGADLYAEEKLRSLSQGQRRCISLIASLIPDPRLLILDEPTNAFDTLTMLRLKKLIAERRNKGMITLFSSHILDFVENTATHILFIKDGRTYPVEKISDGLEAKYLDLFGKRMTNHG